MIYLKVYTMFIYVFLVFILQQSYVISNFCMRNDYHLKLHIVVGGHKENIDVRYFHYLRITEAEIFQYVRHQGNDTIDNITGILQPNSFQAKCNMTFHKVHIINHGKEAVAFYDHVARHYDNLPDALVLLHGHTGNGWHTSCWSIYSRIVRYFYLLQEEKRGIEHNMPYHSNISSYMVTLNSHPSGAFRPGWYGGTLEYVRPLATAIKSNDIYWEKERRLESRCDRMLMTDEEDASYSKYYEQQCAAVLSSYNIFYPDFAPIRIQGSIEGINSNMFCCASFIVPKQRLLRNPQSLYHNFAMLMGNNSNHDYYTSRYCFEYIIYPLLGNHQPATDEEKDFYASSQSVEFNAFYERFFKHCFDEEG